MDPLTPAPRRFRPSSPAPRTWLAPLPFLAAALAFAAGFAALGHRLPDPLATHFDARGHADDYTSVQGFLVVSLLALVALGAGSAALARSRRAAPGGRWVVAAGWATAAGLAVPVWVTLMANADVSDAAAVRIPLGQVVLVPVAALLAGAAGWLLAGPDPVPERPRPGAAPRLPLRAGEAAGWSRTVSSPLLALVALLTLAGAVYTGLTAGWVAGGVLLLCAALSGLMASVRVTVDRRGLALAPALLPYPVRRIPLDRVAEATSREIAVFAEFGGWGYRVRPGRSGLVLRSGDGIVLRLTNGREFAVTVDDAATAAALFNTCLDRARSARGDA